MTGSLFTEVQISVPRMLFLYLEFPALVGSSVCMYKLYAKDTESHNCKHDLSTPHRSKERFFVLILYGEMIWENGFLFWVWF